MPVVVKLTFPAGRYHATPWGRHVNEGVHEWPPSPWRILRALVAVWNRTAPQFSTEQVERILRALLSPPNFRLPAHRVAHTRHYMPWEKKGPLDRTLVFDTFVVVNRQDHVVVGWPEANLSGEDRNCLAELLNNLSTLGRAEGWIEAELIENSFEWNCQPVADEGGVAVFCPDPDSAMSGEHFPIHDAKKLKKGLKSNELLFDSPPWHLCLDTQTMNDSRWSKVPGARWVNYSTPKTTLSPKSKLVSQAPITVVRFRLDGKVLPLVTDTMFVAEQFRFAAMSQLERYCEKSGQEVEKFRRQDASDRFSSEILAGRNLEGQMVFNHDHAYYLPTAEKIDDRRRITHVFVYSRTGFGTEELAALNAIRQLKALDLQVLIVGRGNATTSRASFLGTSKVWESLTPFLGPAHIGRFDQARYLRKAIRKEAKRLVERGFLPAEPAQVEVIDNEDLDKGKYPFLPLEYRRQRNRQNDRDGYRVGAFIRLRFDTEVTGPLSLGYASHFGFGLMRPE